MSRYLSWLVNSVLVAAGCFLLADTATAVFSALLAPSPTELAAKPPETPRVDRSWAERNLIVARNLFNAFDESKRRSVERMLDPAVSRYPVAWGPIYAARMRDMFGGDPFPFGIEENRATWEQMLLYTYQQGIAHKHVRLEDIFPDGIMTKVVV